MALNPNYLDSLPNSLVEMYSLVEIDILEDMARRISTYDYFIPAALHQNQKLQELGMVQEHIIQALSAMTGQTQEEIVRLLTEASEEAVSDDVEYYKRADVYKPTEINSEALHKQLNSGLLQTQQAFKNITRTTANTATKQFENALDRAWTQIMSGGMDYTTAVNRAIKDLAQQGIGAIAYSSGRVDSIEVAVRRAVVTGANQTAAKAQEVLADELGVELVEVTAHGGARPEHAKWQGKVFSRHGDVEIDGVKYKDLKEATGYGTGAGLGGWNCRHNFHPYIPGAPRTWTDKELKKLDEKNITYNGEKYSEYEASQIQRGIERDIRSLKRQVAAIEAGGGDASVERSKLRKAQKGYTDFTEQTGLKKQQARTQTASVKSEKAVDKAFKTADVKTPTKKDIQEQREAAEEEKRKADSTAIVKSTEYAVSNSMLQRREYSNKFNSMSNDKNERKEFLKNAKEILNHRSGQNGEDLYLYNTRLKRWYKSTSGTMAGTPEYTQEIKDGITNARQGELIAFHNHPASMPPSDKDLNAALHNKYKNGYVFCHDGKIFRYNAPKIPIDETIYNIRVAKLEQMGYNTYDAQFETIKYLSEVYGFVFEEVE